MAKRKATAGQLLVNEVLPEDLRDYTRVLDKKGLSALLSEVALRHPEQYREISHKLGKIGRMAAYSTGGNSFGLEHMRRANSGIKRREVLQQKINALLDDDNLDDSSRENNIVKLVGELTAKQQEEIFQESMAENNPLAKQLAGAGRGNKMNLSSLRGSDGLYQDHRSNIIPVPVLRSYSQGLSPAEYWAGTYGARLGVMATKFCIAAGTLVMRSDFTPCAIERLAVGEEVFTVSPSGELITTKVTAVMYSGVKECLAYHFYDKTTNRTSEVVATEDHKILARKEGGSKVAKLRKLKTLTIDYSAAICPTHRIRGDGTRVDLDTGRERLYMGAYRVGKKATYDISVSHESHQFVLANFLVVSNSTQDAGTLSKQLNQISHRSLVTDLDRDGEPDTIVGLPVDVNDDESEGSLLAVPAGPYKRNTVLTPKILGDLRKRGLKRLLVRSPAVSGTPDGGVYARDAGVREFGRLPTRGENIGLAAAQALSEPISQGQLSTKHSGGVAGESKAVSGFEYLNNLVQVPKTMKGGAAHATIDGKVQLIEDAPAGGKYVTINNQRHYVASGYDLKVKQGDDIEAGDVISEGIPNPAQITKYKGIGEGRRYFINTFRDAMRDAGMKGHRRNIELLSRGLINHVRLTDEIGDYATDDIVPYSMLAANYQPREGFRSTVPKGALNQYLERPYLHYSIGTKVRPSMLKDFDEFGIKSVDVHAEPPPFESEMIRGMSNLQHDPDWMTRMLGSGLKRSLLSGVQRGATSNELGTSFVPSRAKAVDFGRVGKVRTPKDLWK